MRTVTLLNQDWLFAPEQLTLDAPDSDFTSVTLPHTNKILPYHNFDNADYQFISTYRKHFTLPEAPNGRRVFIDFDGAMLVSTVYINGYELGTHKGGYTPFSYDITDHLNMDGDNVLTVVLDSHERPDVPPFGYVVDYLTFGGIYRDVWLRMVEPQHFTGVFAVPRNVLTEPELTCYIGGHGKGHFVAKLTDAQGTVVGENALDLEIETDFSTWVTIEPTAQIELWELNRPTLYTLTMQLYDRDGGTLHDEMTTRVGFREALFREDGFFLNGERVQLRGLNRHQTYPYIGAAAPARLQKRDADIVKYELGCNIVRTSHYPQSPYFLDRCDEIGLLVFEEIPGWQHIGDDDWKQLSMRDVRAMIERDRNHPSIVIWGVRINESWDDDNFYRHTNALAHELDPTRPTTGVRFFQDSSFLEDVFGFNDFSNGVEQPKNKPHLITEYNGHMYPTKTFDGEERRIEHSHRHALVQNLAYGNDDVLGAIGWCAFDYNTHKEFGSGDRICYHGVMDIFRLPKWAAAVYASQQDPADKIVLQPATDWTMGDRSEGGNDPILVLSNVEKIDVWYGDEFLGNFEPDRETYPHLPHPPFNVTGLGMMMMWGQAFGTLRIVGYINGEAVIERKVSSDGVPKQLHLTADFDTLHADGSDMTALNVRITDEFGNTLPYALLPVTVTIDSDIAEIVGDVPMVLAGGQGAVYLKAKHTAGTVTVTASTPRLASVSVTVTIV